MGKDKEQEISRLLARGRKKMDKNILTGEQKDILRKNMNISEDEDIAKEYPGAECVGHLGEIDKNFCRLWLWIDRKGHKVITYDEGNCCCSVVQVF